MAALLQSQGYATGCVGKWHLGWNWAKLGPAQEAVDFARPITNGPTSISLIISLGSASARHAALCLCRERSPDRGA
ncbi:MAG: sulfatase-like hydrolase/transferase [Caldilineaceae bacterium]